jgi:hypothetical protein
LLVSLILFLRYLSYQGLILLLDELETVMSQSAAQCRLRKCAAAHR